MTYIEQPDDDTVWMTIVSHPVSGIRYQEASFRGHDWARVVVEGSRLTSDRLSFTRHEIVSPTRDTDSAYRQYQGRVQRAIEDFENEH